MPESGFDELLRVYEKKLVCLGLNMYAYFDSSCGVGGHGGSSGGGGIRGRGSGGSKQ